MRLWTISPSYLDAKGLVAAWREGLLAQKVLHGGTKGYANHPQLIRFKESPSPAGWIAVYLADLCAEASRRGYSFDASKIGPAAGVGERIPVASGQVAYELTLLKFKLERRDPKKFDEIQSIDPWGGGGSPVALNAAFSLADGPVAPWEKVIPEARARLPAR
ncbi:MAG: DNA-(apurinic or apyrimidinic site) lyase [Spirochaetes bacterium]|nr:MAG: DNA-(apurinic or apyrimidinic site) lyase [Spirochaetota bacterium]